MEEQELTRREDRLPGEVVEVYRQRLTREVVETYVRPLPGRLLPPPPPAVKPERRKKGLWIFLGCCLLVAVLATGAWFWNRAHSDRWDPFDYYYDGKAEDGEVREITIPGYPTGQGAELTVETGHGGVLTAQDIYRQVNPAVVTVIAQMGTLEDGASVGTGVIFREDGYVLTNHHVLEGGRDCTVMLDDGRGFEGLYVAGDAENDLAVLKVDLTDLPAAEFGSSEALSVGDPVYAIGNPLGMELRGTLTDGIVSAINRDVWVDGRTMTLIQTNAALNSGNSGGPLINQYGQVVGINTIKMSSSYSNIEGLGFAIPSASIKRLVNDLLTYGEVQPEPVLGVSVMQVGTQLAGDLWGVEVVDVTAGSAADLAGIQVGDFVLTAGGTDIHSSGQLLQVRRQCHIGDELPMTLWRDGEIIAVTLKLEQAGE